MDDRELWEAFSSSSLPETMWTHRAHLRVAWMILKRFPLDEAHHFMRIGVIRLNAFHGLVESTTRGYHDSMTRAWLILISALMNETGASSSEVFLDVCGDQLEKGALKRYYSEERIQSVRARVMFVEPDLVPLPT